jgi:hypothetical protein
MTMTTLMTLRLEIDERLDAERSGEPSDARSVATSGLPFYPSVDHGLARIPAIGPV